MPRRCPSIFWVALLVVSAGAYQALAAPRTAPQPGLRESSPEVHALVDARIVVSPERTIDKGTLVVRDGVIVAVGDKVVPPADARIWNMAGKTLYPGLIDAYSELPARLSKSALGEGGAGYWNANVTPQVRAASIYTTDAAANRKLRASGITSRLVAPSAGIIKGTSSLVSTADDTGKQVILKDPLALHLKLTTARGSEGYPTSPMGALTLVRQAFYDAGWYGEAWNAFGQHPELSRPERNDALAVLGGYLSRKPVVIVDSSDELYFLRADRLAKEFSLNVIVRGSGEEYRRLDDVKASGRAVIVPLDFPKPPDVATPEAALNVSLARLMHWDLAPENPARLSAAGVKIALTGHGLGEKVSLLSAVRKAIKRGLSADAALRALTVTPAELFEVSGRLGTLEAGKAANLVVTDGPLFAAKTKISETWVDGTRYEVEAEPTVDMRGTWRVETTASDGKPATYQVELGGTAKKLSGKIKLGDKSASLMSPAASDAQFTSSFKGKSLDVDGVVQLSLTVSKPATDKADGEWTWLGTVVWPDGKHVAATGKRLSSEVPKGEKDAKRDDKPAPDKNGDAAKPQAKAAPDKPEAAKPNEKDKPDAPAKTDDMPPAKGTDEKPADEKDSPADPDAAKADAPTKALSAVNYPLGEFGREKLPDQPAAVLFRNATVWTSGPQGKLEAADVLVAAGKIQAVGTKLTAPEGAIVVDCTGKHLSPGIIDCHSHIATDGAVNEVGQTITAEVRIGDFVDPNDINIYRQLAGGVTSSNILHGSANTIGGQNQVLKFRWGAGPEEMKFSAAPQGIKFALGENVKQSNWNARTSNRYPQTRMGVEQLVRDAFASAKDYRREWDQWKRTKSGLPPRVDLELEALAEVLEGTRLVHCHSYRQDEILALMRTCEAFGVKIATFQHILEGYKVADVMARHGVGGSSFSDWWAYKFEVLDAIPYNGALLHNAGVVVSFNSDNAELARRLNLEATKAVKYGGVSPEEALKFVTLNPARQLKVDAHVGSLEAGKDADLVVWSASPLSTSSRCEQTWVDGRRYFDREEDARQRAAAQSLRAALVQRILASGEPSEGPDDAKKDQWPREDIFCDHGQHDDHHHHH